MSELVTIEASKREKLGKGPARRMRKEGIVPGNLVVGTESTPLQLQGKLLSKAWRNDKTFNLSFNGEVKKVRIQELQIDPAKRLALHVDLMPA